MQYETVLRSIGYYWISSLMSLRYNERPITDEALLLLFAARRDFMAARIADQCRPRIVSSVLGTADPLQMNYQATILRLFSTIEAYVDALIGDLLRQRIESPVSLLTSIIQEVELNSTRNWNERENTLRRIFGIRLPKQNSWKEIVAARHARNSIAHGLGRLTAQQLQNRSLALKLDHIRIHISNGRIVIADESISIVFRACVSFVKSLDAATGSART